MTLPRTGGVLWSVWIVISYVAVPTADATGLIATSSEEGHLALLFVWVFLALFFSFLCSIAEAALLSITPAYVESLRRKSPRRAQALRRLRLDDIDRSLAAILTLNTIAHTVGSIAAGAEASAVFGSAWFGVFSAVMTLLILFLSEIIPKTIGAVYWPNLVGVTIYYVQGIIVLLYPLVWISEWLTKLVARGQSPHRFSREEFLALADIGKQSGLVEDRESRIIANLFRFGSLIAKDIMTPRIVMEAFPQDASVMEALNKAQISFSRLPVYDENIDNIVGFVLKDDLLFEKLRGKGETKLKALKRDILKISASTRLSALLEMFLANRQQIIVLLDEHGGTKGLVTLEDVIETLLGAEIVDELDRIEDLQAWARQQWSKRARALGLDQMKFH